MTQRIYVLRCQLCQKSFKTRNLRSFAQTARKHREKMHPEHKGSLRYAVIPQS